MAAHNPATSKPAKSSRITRVWKSSMRSKQRVAVARRGLTARSSNCPHGRPTTLKLSLGDLEKQFKRTGF